MRTYSPKASDITRDWHVIDAEGAILGRLATEIATLLRGKHKPIWVPHMDVGDHVVIVNASKLADRASASSLQKTYHRHSGYPGGISSESLEHLLARDPEKVVQARGAPHAAEGPARSADAAEAEGVRRPDPPAPGAAARRPSAARAQQGARRRMNAKELS